MEDSAEMLMSATGKKTRKKSKVAKIRFGVTMLYSANKLASDGTGLLGRLGEDVCRDPMIDRAALIASV